MTLSTIIAVVTMIAPGQCGRCKESPATPIRKASEIAAKRSGRPAETESLIALLNREHGWSIKPSCRFDLNKSTQCYGLGQFKPATWANVGIKKTDCQVCQIEGIYLYCGWRKEYGSIKKAVIKWDSRRKWKVVRGKRVLVGGWY